MLSALHLLNFWLLTDQSRDLSQAEKKISVLKVEQIHKMTTTGYLTLKCAIVYGSEG